MGCVNIKSKDFKNLALSNNVSDSTLELIVHKYWIERGSEDQFPSNVYVKAQLGNAQYKESGKNVRALWKASYSTSKEFESIEEVQKAVKDAKKFFPESAIVYYKNAKGTFTLSVKEPVKHLKRGVRENITNLERAKTIDLGIDSSSTYTIAKIEELFNRFNTDRRNKILAERVFKTASNMGIKVVFDESLPSATVGRYSFDTITLKKSFFEKDIQNADKAPILLHEVIHAVTMYALSDLNTVDSEVLNNFKTEINSIFQDVRNNEVLKGERGIADINEFVAELSNPIFCKKLQSIDKKSFWQRILDAIKSLFGVKTSDSYYNRAMTTLDGALNAFDINSYLNYTGLKSLLQEGFLAEEWQFRQLSEEKLKEIISKSPRTTEELRRIIQSMSKQQLIDALFSIEHEFADYELLHPESKESSSTNKQDITPQPFTFNDGTTVTAPFRPNNQQIDALNAISDFINSDETTMTLSGYAGTGKTSLMEMVAQKMRKNGKRILFSASTNKAAAVLKERVSKSGFNAYTLNKVFGINVEVDSNKSYDAKQLINVLKDSDLLWGGEVVIIDEASMINEENYKILNEIAEEYKLKIIYVGDEAQLAPVKEEKISKVFRNGDGKVVRLTQVERTSDNAILKEATDLRNGKSLSGETSFNAQGKGVAYIKSTNKETIRNIVNHFVPGLKNNPNFFRILAATNAAVSRYNVAVRNALGYQDQTPRVGEPMTGYDNWGYNWRTRETRLINSESYEITRVEKPYTTRVDIGNVHVQVEIIPITLKDSFGKTDTFNYIDVKNNPKNLEAATALAKEKSALWDLVRRTTNGEAKAKIYSTINEINNFLFINDDITEGDRTLQKKVIDFGYALTIHKSQGSTFTHVLIDDPSILKFSKNKANVNSFSSVDLGESSEVNWDNLTLDSTLDIDLGDLSDVEITEDTNTIDKTQQLRYVAVSRATDTVTIISDNVKKEGSPLEPYITKEDKITTSENTFDTKNAAIEYKKSLIERGIKSDDIEIKYIPATAKEDEYWQINVLQNTQEENKKDTSELTEATEKTLQALRKWYKFASKHITFNKEDHKYYIDGNPIDFSATGYAESVYGKKDIQGDYSHSIALGNTIDSIYRDFFEKGEATVKSTTYPNINDERKEQILKDLHRLQQYLINRFGKNHKVITTEFPIAAYVEGKMGLETIAGTIDMIVIDDKGDIHIFDFKTKNHPITKTYKGKEVDDRRDYTAQQNLYRPILESLSPELKGKVKSLQLIWLDTDYPKLSQASYTTDAYGNVTIDGRPIAENPKFITPSLKENIEESIIPLDITSEVDILKIPQMSPIDTVVDQLVDHMESMGLNIRNENDMKEFFETKPNSFIQESADANISNEESQIEWVNNNKENLINTYIERNGNRVDPDLVRELLAPLGYTTDKIKDFYNAGVILYNYVLDAAFENLANSDNKTISITTGTPGSGKGFVLDTKQNELSQRGLVIDSPTHSIQQVQSFIDRAKNAGVKEEDIQVYAVYNDFETTFNNSIQRGKVTGRYLPLEYFIDAFRRRKGLLEGVSYNNPNIKIITIDNSKNQNKEVSLQEAYNWDYSITNNQVKKLKNLIQHDGEINEYKREEILQESSRNDRRRISGNDTRSIKGERETYRRRTDEEILHLVEKLSVPTENRENAIDFLERALDFLGNFDITINDINDYQGDMPLFDALERTINIRSVEDITEGIGQAIAFMMQYNPSFKAIVELKMLDSNPTALKGIRRALKKHGAYHFSSLKSDDYKKIDRSHYIKEIGKDIAKELKTFYSLETSEKSSYVKKIWDILVEFFSKLDANLRNKLIQANHFSSNAAFAVIKNDPSFIRNSNIKPGSENKGDTQIVDIGKALIDFPYEESIVRTLNSEGIALAGGASIAAFGVLKRPLENPLHDLDFNATSFTTNPEDIQKILDKHYPNNAKTNTILSENAQTDTYLILDRPFIIEKEQGENIIKDAKTKEELGRFIHSELVLKEGVQGKFLDFFLGEGNKSTAHTIPFNGKEYLFANYQRAMQAKVTWAREKDIWDYNNFKLYDVDLGIQEFKTLDGKELYGFVDTKDNIYLDRNIIKPEHPIHEYTHVWDRYVAKKNPKLWNHGISLMKQLPLWEEIANNSNYGAKWKANPDISESQLESLIASEVHSRLVGKEGAALLDKLAKEEGQKNIISKLKEWILDFWKELKATFSNWSEEDLNKLTLEDFTNMTVRDFAEGINPINASMPSSQFEYARNSKGRPNYEVSSRGDKRFSAMTATFAPGTTLFGHDVSGRTIESVYQHGVKQGDWVTNNNSKTGVPKDETIITGNTEDDSYRQGYLPLWQEWAKQNPQLIEELRQKAQGRVITDMFASTAVSQARALADILNSSTPSLSQPTNTPSTSTFASNAELYSGNADGADKYWGAEARALGIKVKDYTGSNYRTLSQEQKDVVEEEYKNARAFLGKPVLPIKDINNDFDPGVLTRRDMMQADSADAIFAVAERIVKPGSTEPSGGKVYTNNTGHDNVQGGTANAVARGIIRGIPVYVFDQSDNQWKIWDKNTNSFVVTSEPTLTPHAATIGTRGINEDGKQAVRSVLTKAISGKQKLTAKLPNYEYFNDLYEDTTVDAEWKISLLEDLDNQITQIRNADDYQQGDEDTILNQMDRLISAISKEEYDDLISKPKKKIEKTLGEFEKLTQQINTLYNSEYITSSEVRHTAELVVNAISDIILDIQKGTLNPEEIFTGFSSDLDFSKATRRKIVDTIGIDKLIERAKENFDPANNTAIKDRKTLKQAILIIDNWDAIVTMAADVFAANEGFGIHRDYTKGNFTTVDGQNGYNYDDFNESKDTESIEETEGDAQEHWQIESRTIDVVYSMSQIVRQALRECYELDSAGNKIISKWGIPERVNARNAVNSILRWTQGALTLDDMIQKLSDKQDKHPWLSQLISKLSDKTGDYADLQSQFFGVFNKHFQSYSIVLKENGEYYVKPVNDQPANKEIMDSIIAAYKMGQHSLFTSKGINEGNLGSNDTINSSKFNLHKGLAGLKAIVEKLKHNTSLTEEDMQSAINNILGAVRILGFNAPENLVENALNTDTIKEMTTSLSYIVSRLDSALQKQKREGASFEYEPFTYEADNNIAGDLKKFITPITNLLEDTAINAFYDSGKMYQSYVTPSYLSKLMLKFQQEGQVFEDFILEEYGKSEWFKEGGKTQWKLNQGWRNEWLRMLATDESARKVFAHKVELNFNKHNYMRNMTDAEYTLSLITEYFAESSQKKESLVPAWFRIPMQSNKPSSEFIKFYSYRGSDYKTSIVDGMYKMFTQELSRIQTVRLRGYDKKDPRHIKNFDSKGRNFRFLSFLNPYLENTSEASKNRTLLANNEDNSKLASLLQKAVEGKKLNNDEEVALTKLVSEAIYNFMNNRSQSILNSWENNGILEASKSIKGILPPNIKNDDADILIKEQIENFLWNDYFAANNILQLTIVDIAFYKDAEDLQKRLAQLHAPGTRGNINATDYKGNPVTDGKYRTIVLKDFEEFVSNIIDNITEVFNRKIATAPEHQQAQLEALKESLVGKEGVYRKINVTDAQGYSSPSSYRKKALIFGKWSEHFEDIYQKLLKGQYTYSDLETAFQPLKPFMYSQLQKNIGVEGSPIQTMNVPFQAKNSEYLLIMADAIIKGEEAVSGKMSRPNLLRAIFRVMEDSEKNNPTQGIDTVQFESSIKSGLQGALSIHTFENEDDAYDYMMNRIYEEEYNPSGEKVYKNYNVNTYVHETPYENYCLQQEVPAHFKNHAQAQGSQERMIIPSDLDYYKNPNGDVNDENNIVYYEWTEPNGTKKKLKADEIRKEYEETIAKNIEQSIDELSKELHLDSFDKKERNIALSKLLLREILSSPRYGIDLAQACSIDSKTGEFRIPKGDPIQAKRIEQLINSLIKNKVNKQKIAGGPVVQVSNFGTSKQLHIRFNHKNGGLLMTREEYEEWEGATKQSYEEYVKENQAGIAYFEVFAPIWDDSLIEKFGNEDGTINIEAIEATDPELLKLISYRIPTEDKYSIAPMKIIGFLPREAGEGIMFPYELTGIDGSDFDIDKRYVMRKDIPIVKKNRAEIQQQLFDILSESYSKAHEGKTNNKWVGEQVKMFMDNPKKMRHTDAIGKFLYQHYQRIAYTTNPPTSGKTYRDNKIMDMTWAILTNEMTADKILNPGGFDNVKKMGYMVAAYKNPNNHKSWEELQKLSIDGLKKEAYTEKDLAWVDTQVQFYRQNSAAASLIGVFAVNKVAHATLEGNDLYIAIDELFGGDSFTIADTKFEDRMQLDKTANDNGELLGKVLGTLVAASVDAVKDPVLNLMNINMNTAGMLTSMIRLGMTFEDASLFLSQNVIEKVLNEFNRENLTGSTSLYSIIEKRLQAIRDTHDIAEDSNINTEPLTRKELIEGLTSEEHEVIDYKVLLAFQKIKTITDVVKKPTFATRFNSISSAVGPLIVDNIITRHKMEQFLDSTNEDGTHLYTKDGIPVDITDIFADHPILKQFARTVDIAEVMFKDMPAGSTGFKNVLNALPEELKDKFYSDKKLLDQLSMFYQSYLLVASGFIDSTKLKEFIEEFPKKFLEENIQEKYPNNALVQSIKVNVAKRTNRPYLAINITGADAQQKEELSNAWVDLHKEDPELSNALFIYNFFRAGIGFSPKTFMSLIPTYVKERLVSEDSTGNLVFYTDVFRNFPQVPISTLVDQFIRNNWENSKIVPIKGTKDSKYQIKGDTLTITDSKTIQEFAGYPYIRTRNKNYTYMWKLESGSDEELIFKRVLPLGNNGEYLEISMNEIKTPLSETTQTVEDSKDTDLKENTITETGNSSSTVNPIVTPRATVQNLEWFINGIIEQRKSIQKPISRTDAENMAEGIKKNPKQYKKYMINVFKQLGVEVSEENVINKFNELC